MYQVDVGLLRVDVSDELVQVLEPGDGRVVVEVGAHRHHDVVGGVMSCLKFGAADWHNYFYIMEH
jgi:hypothetical protein